jgi:Esterase FrsA-like
VLEFADIAFRQELQELMLQARGGAASADDVLATAERIVDGDAESWVLEWMWAAGELWARANGAVAVSDIREAGRSYLQAASYYAAALSQMRRADEHTRVAAVWRRQRWCWEQAIALGGVDGEALEIPYLRSSLPGHFFPARGAAGCRRPLVIMHNGIYRPTSAMLGLGGMAAAARGYHWMTFDGPGQQAALHQRGLTLRADWEAVLACVLDAMRDRIDVDQDRIVAIGVGHAGYLLPRALAREHRLAAVAIQPGIVDAAAPWRAALTNTARALFAAGDTRGFDQTVRAELFSSRQAEWSLRELARPFGVADAAPSSMLAVISEYQLADQLASLRTPILIVDDQHPSWPGQSHALHRRLALSELRPLSNDPSAHEHDLFAWLERHLG